MEDFSDIISDSEQVARLIDNEWIVNGRLQLAAFALRRGETYISVNRLSAPTYITDVETFIKSHPSYSCDDDFYHRATLSVGGIRQIVLEINGEKLAVNVEVEARSRNIASHAGIFVRHDGKNIKTGT